MPANPTTTAILELNAVDNTTAVVRKVSGAVDGLRDGYAKLQGVLGSLGVGLGVGYFASVIKGSIDAMDHLNDLAKTADLAVETMAGLGIAAKQSGGDLDSVAASINKLSVNIGKDSEKFARLGVTAKDPLEAFKQLSDIFVAIKDPQLRAAVGAEALGKSWAGAAPLLLEGSKRIGEMVEAGTKASGVTGEMARQADEFNDKLAGLVGTGKALTLTVGPLLPLMNMLADDMIKARDGAKGFSDGVSPLLEVLKTLLVLGSDVSFVFTQMGKDIARAVENVKLVAKGDWAGSRALGETFRKDGVESRAALDAWQKRIIGVGTTGGATSAAAEGGTSATAAAAAAAKAAAFLKAQGGAAEDADGAYRSLLKGLKEKLLVDGELTEVARLQLALDALSKKNRASITADLEEELKALAAKIDLNKQLKSQMENDAKNEEALNKIRQEGIDLESEADAKRIAAYDANQKTIEQIQFETQLIGLSNEARETAIALRAMEAAGIKQSDSAYAGEAQRLRDALAVRQAAQQADELRKHEQQGWLSMWSAVESTGRNVWTIMTAGGEGMAKSVGRAIKSSIADLLYQLTAKKWLFQIGAGITSSLGMAAADAATQQAAGSFLGSGASSIMSSLGLGNLPSIGTALGNVGSAVSTFSTLLGEGATMMEAFSAASAGMGASALSLLGPIGLAVGAAAAFGLFDGGGPKASEVWLQGGPGSFNVGMNNVAGGDPDMNQVRALNAMLQDPTKFDQGVLGQYVGQVMGTGGPADTATLISKLTAAIQPASDAAQKQVEAAAVVAQETATQQQVAAELQLEAARRQVELVDRDKQLNDQLLGAVRSLADDLGIKALQDARSSLAVSDYLSPANRLAGARSQFDTTLAGARGGDLDAVSALPGVVQTLLGVGRDVFASGAGFQDLFREANSALGEVLSRQQAVQTDILKDVPMTIVEASRDQVAELRRGFTAMAEELAAVRDELRRSRQAA